MTKICKKRIVISAISVLAILIILLASVLAYYDSLAIVPAPLAETYVDWMKYIDDDVLLVDTVIPGTHDSGSKGMVWMAETQSLSIYDQLRCGVRYLDIRIQKTNKGHVIFHGPIKGALAEKSFEEIRNYVSEYETETVILDFQHFENGSQPWVMEKISEYLGEYVICVDGDSSKSEFIENLTLGNARGKCIVFWGSEDEYAETDGIFLRNDDTGDRAGSMLQSYYSEEFNALDSSEYIAKGLPHYIDTFRQNGNGFFVLQGQLTDGWRIRGPRFREAGNAVNMSDYIVSLAESDDLDVINIIMRDYINCQKTKEIIGLNYYKNTVKSDSMKEFCSLFIE